MKQEKGHLVISLDFELLWGVFDVVDFSEKKKYFQNTHKVIPQILEEFRRNGIHATWAIVGMLFNENWQEWEQNIPEAKPNYENEKLSAYDFGKKINSEETANLCFAPKLIEEIKKIEGQEIATHTYSHYYCMEPGQNIAEFKADLEQAVKVAKEKNINLASLIFPRNQIDESYLKVCKDLGIETVRSNPSNWYWKDPSSEALLIKICRTGDAYFSFGKRKSYPFSELEETKSGVLTQKASRFFRPYETNKFLHKLKMKRIKSEMLEAAKNNEIYHLWWHPHNFGDHPEESMHDLKEILTVYQECREKYSFGSAHMQDIHEMFLKQKK